MCGLKWILHYFKSWQYFFHRGCQDFVYEADITLQAWPGTCIVYCSVWAEDDAVEACVTNCPRASTVISSTVLSPLHQVLSTECIKIVYVP